jgi:adenylosuccinate synthase
MKNLVVVGVQWGDEGKGKIVDLLAERYDVIARYGGGHNAGHTVKVGNDKFILQLIPCGIFRPGKIAVIGNGVVIDPQALQNEIAMLAKRGIEAIGRLFVSYRAHLIFPHHRMMEKAAQTGVRIGTTSRGIGPAYEDKMGRRGIRVADLLDRDTFREQVRLAVREKNFLAAAFQSAESLDEAQVETE